MLRIHLGFAMVIGLLAGQTASLAAEEKLPGSGDVPSFLVTSNSKQVYRFHFSGLQAADAIRLAQQLWPVVAKLPAENPLRKAMLQAKDAASFADDYRSLRNCFLEAGIDTIYFIAEDHWIESVTLPGYVVLPGTPTTISLLQKRLEAAGHPDWVQFVAGLRPAQRNPGWMVSAQGNVAAAGGSAAKAALVEHAFRESCPIKPATVSTRNLPALQINLNETVPLTVVNLEKNSLDIILSQLLTTLAPAAARTAQLLDRAEGTTVAVSSYPFPFVRQIAHLGNANQAQALAAEINKAVNGAVQQVVDLDADIGPLLGMFARSMVSISTHGNDVVLVMKPPVLFDLDMAQRTARETQEQDWTALAAPAGCHWELIGALGGTNRNDVLSRVESVRVRGSGSTVAGTRVKTGSASFRVPVKDFTLNMTCDARGRLKIDPAAKGEKPGSLPALELLDDRGRVVAVLRLDLGPGDPRFDLARTRALLHDRQAEHADAEKKAKKELDDAENSYQRIKLEKKQNFIQDWEDKLNDKARVAGQHRAALLLMQGLEKKVAALQLRFPGTCVVKDGEDAAGASNPLMEKHKQFRFAGQWLFDHGMLTLYQDSKGIVAGTYSSKVFHIAGRSVVDEQKDAQKIAVVCGQAEGATLKFTLFDTRGRERTGKLVLDADGLGGSWNLDVPAKAESKDSAKMSKESKLFDPMAKAKKEVETASHGRLDRLDTGLPEAVWFQEVETGAFAGYWVHATNKTNNTLLKLLRPGWFEGSNGGGGMTRAGGNLKAVAAGNVLFLVQSPGNFIEASVRDAILSADGQKLTFDPAPENAQKPNPFGGAPMSPFQRAGAGQKGIELTRQGKD